MSVPLDECLSLYFCCCCSGHYIVLLLAHRMAIPRVGIVVGIVVLVLAPGEWMNEASECQEDPDFMKTIFYTSPATGTTLFVSPFVAAAATAFVVHKQEKAPPPPGSQDRWVEGWGQKGVQFGLLEMLSWMWLWFTVELHKAISFRSSSRKSMPRNATLFLLLLHRRSAAAAAAEMTDLKLEIYDNSFVWQVKLQQFFDTPIPSWVVMVV